jgi:uncharacterized protein (DUF433 family)
MSLATVDSRIDVPIYTRAEAARYLGVPASTFSTWTKGYVRHFSGRPDVRGEPFITSLAAQPRQPEIPFIGLVEGMVATAFRRAGVSLQHIRAALTVLDAEIGIEHALASRRLCTDGAKILYDYRENLEDEELTVVVSGQRVFPEIVQAYLKKIEYADDGLACRLVLPITEQPLVECDPYRGFGMPRFIRGGAPMSAVIDRYRAGDSIREVAEDFDLRIDDVEDVIRAALATAA